MVKLLFWVEICCQLKAKVDLHLSHTTNYSYPVWKHLIELIPVFSFDPSVCIMFASCLWPFVVQHEAAIFQTWNSGANLWRTAALSCVEMSDEPVMCWQIWALWHRHLLCPPAVIWTVGSAVTPSASPANYKPIWQQQQQLGHILSSPFNRFPRFCPSPGVKTHQCLLHIVIFFKRFSWREGCTWGNP